MKVLFTILLCLLNFSVFAKEIKVVYAKGNVKIFDIEGNKSKALKGMIVKEGELISTAKSSFVILKIEGHSVHRVEEETTLRIDELPYNFEDSEELEQGGNLYLKVGTIFSEVIKKSDNDSLTIKTKNTTMGVRGTKFMVSSGGENQNTWLSVDEGEVEIKNDLSKNHDVVSLLYFCVKISKT